MALSRFGSGKEFSNIFAQLNNGGGLKYTSKSITPKHLNITKTVNFHRSGIRYYPNAPQLPLPSNVVDIFGNETGRFTPERARDIAAPVLLYGSGSANRQSQRRTWDASLSAGNCGSMNRSQGDSHVDSYDCFGAVSLNSSMQSMVPKPFCSDGKSTYLNMPGGQFARDGKYISEIMQKAHYAVLRQRKPNKCTTTTTTTAILRAYCSTSSSPVNPNESQVKKSVDDDTTTDNSQQNLTKREKLKRAVKDYGLTVVVFHVSISLASLGFFYLLVSSGLDLSAIVKMFPSSNEKLETIMTNSSTFIVAYAVHKVFAPVRISITLTATPFIVRYLRRIGILKMPKTS